MSSVRVTGDFKGLAAFVKKLDGYATTAVPAVAKTAAPELQKAIDSSSRAGQGPSGESYAPRNDGGVAFASVTGSLAKVTARGVELFARVTRKIPRYMNSGRSASSRGGFMPARPIVPEPSAVVPATWTALLVKAAERVFGDKAVR